MAIINNHNKIKLDANFQEKHKELFKVFSDNNLDVEINDNIAGLKSTLTSLPKSDYPYDFDGTFDGISDTTNTFVLLLKSGGTVISTYAATNISYDTFVGYLKGYYTGTFEDVSIDSGNQLYSSCQWVSKDHRGKKLGMTLDHLKKNICFDILNADVNYAIHKESYQDYHKDGLKYDTTKKLCTIPNGDVGGAGEKIDKIYYVTWTSKSSWASKQDDVRKLYS
jgi:hypothetical protein